MKKLVLAGAVLALATPVLAQSVSPTAPVGPNQLTTPGQAPSDVFNGGSPAIANEGPASTGTLSRSGLGSDNASNNPAVSGNAGKVELGQPNTGGGGGGDSTGGGQ